MQTPSEQLAGRIAAALVEAGLILEADAELMTPRVGDGTATREDWRAALENATRSQEEEQTDA